MGKSIKVVFIKQNSSDDFGTLFIRTIEGKTIKKKSIKIKVSQNEWTKFFNTNTQRFREDKRYPQYQLINEKIESILSDLQTVKGDLDLLHNDKKSFLDYWDFCIKNTSNHGTIIKNQVVKSKLQKFLLTKKRTNLYFIEITPLFLKELKHYLETSKDPKTLSQNSVNHYLKIIKSVINKSIVDDYYTYIKHPFNSVTFSNEKLTKNVLSDDELVSLLTTKIENEQMNQIRDLFLFQIFSNGMRISDLLLLKWSNLSSNNKRLTYTMFKTGTPMSIPVNINMSFILSRRINQFERYQFIYTNTFRKFSTTYQKLSPFGKNIVLPYTVKSIEEIINRKVVKEDGYNYFESTSVSDRYNTGRSGSVKVSVSRQDQSGSVVHYKGYKIWDDDYELMKVIDHREKLIEDINDKFIGYLLRITEKKEKNLRNEFVFPLLSKDLFKKYDVSKKKEISLEQYKNMKHCTIVYNRQLKKLQEFCKIQTSLSSHVSRHSFTNLLLKMEGINLYDVSQSLGHSSIKITENYLSSGFNTEKIDYLNNKISSKYKLPTK